MKPAAPVAKADMQPTAPCPSLEDIAAYLDGTLPPARRDAVEAHLATCESCREILGDAAGLDEFGLDEEVLRPAADAPTGPTDGVRPFDPPARPRLVPRSPRRWRVAAVAAAALAALLLLTFGAIHLLAPHPAEGFSSAEMAALLPSPSDTRAWGRVNRGVGPEEDSTPAPALESFQLGVGQLDLRRALAAADKESVDKVAKRLHRLFDRMDLVLLAPQTETAYQAIASEAQNGGRAADLLSRADAMERNGFVDIVDPEIVAFGRWTEACRLSGGSDAVVRRPELRALLDWLLAKDRGDKGEPGTGQAASQLTNADRFGAPEVTGQIRQIRQELDLPGTGARRAPSHLAEQCQELLEILDGD